jgi:protein-tyrosine phosphatase
MDIADNWSPQQLRRLEEFDAERSVDIHCHCLAGLDDGPQDVEHAVALCEALVADGITTVVATPHQLGRYDLANSAEQVRDAIEVLTAELKDREIPLELFSGGDVRVDERIPRLLESRRLATVADAGSHILLELPHDIFIDPIPIVDQLRESGIQSVLTHPERYPYLQSHPNFPQVCLEHGVVLQVTCGSILGDFGRRAHDEAWRLILAGMVGIIASDAHDVARRPPRMTAAIEALKRTIGPANTRALTIENPLRIVNGEPIHPPESFRHGDA